MNIAIVGGGIAGLSFALGLHQRGIDCDVFESVPEVKEIGVGITLLPHGMRELAALGVQEALEAAGIENLESVFYTQHGQYVYKEARGRHARRRSCHPLGRPSDRAPSPLWGRPMTRRHKEYSSAPDNRARCSG